MCKKHDFWANFRFFLTILYIDSTFFRLETQNKNVGSFTKTVLRILKKQNKTKNFIARSFFRLSVLLSL